MVELYYLLEVQNVLSFWGMETKIKFEPRIKLLITCTLIVDVCAIFSNLAIGPKLPIIRKYVLDYITCKLVDGLDKLANPSGWDTCPQLIAF